MSKFKTIFRTARRNLKRKHKEFLFKEAHKLNGGAISHSSIVRLRQLFEGEFRASISSLVVRRLLAGHQNGNGKPKCKKRSIRSVFRVSFR